MISDSPKTSLKGKCVKRLPFLLLFLIAVILGIATFIEDANGTAFINATVYGTSWFKVLWGAVVAASLWIMWRKQLWRHTAVFTLHISLIMILAGGLTTAITHQSGVMHLRQGQMESRFIDEHQHLRQLPFTVNLDSFYIQYYPGTEAPQDYVSIVTMVSGRRDTISMNRILRQDGYRFYQSSYDPDNKGSWLTVTYDPYGTPIAYFGFLLFGLSAVAVLLTRYRRLSVLTIICCLALSPTISKAAPGIPVVPRSTADSLATRQVIWNDRISPFNTLATDFVRKLYGKTNCKGYTPEQVVASWLLYPDVWNRVPIIKIKEARLRRHLKLSSDYASMSDIFDSLGTYRLQVLYAAESDKTSPLSKAIRETDEKAGLVMMLLDGTLIRPVPEDVQRLSDCRVQAELLYNRIPFVSWLFMTNLTLGLLCLLIFFKKPHPLVFTINYSLLVLSLLVLLIAYALRWYISGRIPLSNGFETVMFVGVVLQCLGLLLSRRQQQLLPFGFLLSGFVLLVAHLGQMNPQITSLMPVLNSPWLSSHVSTIMISYALLSFTFVLSLLYLLRPCSTSITHLTHSLLYPAVLLLGIGIFLGAVWANVSWGTYWSWDPKEVWALITFIIYALPLHQKSLPFFRCPRTYHLYMLFAFLTVLMTYFGVNYVLGGMHSYAN